MNLNNRFKDAMTNSLVLAERDMNVDGLELPDEAITQAIRDDDIRSVCALCHHTANISGFNGNWASVKRYYSQSLACDPENARALYGLAAAALHEGDPVTGRQYATRGYRSTLRSDGEILKLGLLDLIVKNWPELVEK
jgi:hypothetical protein